MLTQEQLNFLQSHGLSEKDTFDALGMAQSTYYPIMKRENKLIAYNVKPCKNGHTLRTRSGHCPQCNTAYLRFLQRSGESGFVYVAISKIGSLCKVGFTHDIQVRGDSLNRTYYANLSDWIIKFAIKSKYAGKIEEATISKLWMYSYELEYDHDNKSQIAKELLKCDYKIVKKTIIDICKNMEYDYEIILNKKIV